MYLMDVAVLSEGVTLLKTTCYKCVLALTVASVTALSASGRQENTRPASLAATSVTPSSTEGNALFGQIRQEVTDLEYTEVVADDFVAMVSDWKTPRGLLVLPALQRMLARSREACKEGRISTSQLATMEEKAAAARRSAVTLTTH